jgi:hypothetical protein
MFRKILLLSAGLVPSIGTSFAQTSSASVDEYSADGRHLNTITTAVPFLLIAPNTRAGGMGDVGAATSADANSIHWNTAKLASAKDEFGISLSYTPWLRQLVNDINLSYLSFYKKMKNDQAFGGSFRYFTLGTIQFTNEQGENTIQFRPNEWALDATYSRKLGKNFYGGATARFIYSNLTGGLNVQATQTRAGNAMAADLAVYYENPDSKIGKKDGTFAAGAVISNIGNKISYTTTSKRDFLPINLRLGSRYTLDLDQYNQLSFAIDLNKLMVPTQPVYNEDSTGLIIAGRDPNQAVVAGMFGSFSDAPGQVLRDASGVPLYNADGTAQVKSGSVLREELSEVTVGIGAEYVYDKQFMVRGGYFWEDQYKGNRKFFTMGAGVKYQVFSLDFSYLFPAYFGTSVQRSPLQNTVRFTMTIALDKLRKSTTETPNEN